MASIDITNQRFGKLTAIRKTSVRTKNGSTGWECVCDCGSTVTLAYSRLVSGNDKSCGCFRRSLIPDLTGKRFNRLTVISRCEGRNASGNFIWLCKCDCGNETRIGTSTLLQESTKSCGCLKIEYSESKVTHGMARRKSTASEFNIWKSAVGRVTNPSNSRWRDYGGRGITMCDEWLHSFEAFYQYVGRRPSVEYSLDRIDVNGNYEPGNVRWADKKTQANNKRKVWQLQEELDEVREKLNFVYSLLLLTK